MKKSIKTIGIMTFGAFAALCFSVVGASRAVVVNAATSTACSWSRSGSTDSATGGTFSQSGMTSKSGYYQDNSTTSEYIQVFNSASCVFSSQPSSISFTAKIGGGSTIDSLTYPVNVVLLNSDGNEISDSAKVVTSAVTATSGSNFTVSLSTSDWNTVYGVRLTHIKQANYNVRFYSFSLSYDYAESTSPSVTIKEGDVFTKIVGDADFSLTAVPSNFSSTEYSYTWSLENEAYAKIVSGGNTAKATFGVVAAGTVKGSIKVSCGEENATTSFSITVNAISCSSVSWADVKSTYYLTNTALLAENMGSITATLNNGETITDFSKMTVSVSSDGGTTYNDVSQPYSFPTAGDYKVRIGYLNKFASAKNFKVFNDSGTVSDAYAALSNISGSKTLDIIGKYTITNAKVASVTNTTYGNGTITDGTKTLTNYSCTNWTDYKDVFAKNGTVSLEGTLEYYYNKSATLEIKNYEIKSFHIYSGLAVKTSGETTFTEGNTFNPVDYEFTVSYNGDKAATTISYPCDGLSYDITRQLTTEDTKITWSYLDSESGLTYTCEQAITVNPDPYVISIPVTSLDMNENDETTIQITASEGYGANAAFDDAPSSTNEDVAIATVDTNGLATIVSGEAGTAVLEFTVYEETADDYINERSCQLTVNVHAGIVTLSESSVTVDIVKEAKEVTISSQYITEPVYSLSESSGHATLELSGNKITVTPVSVGTETITVTAKNSDNTQSGTATLNITVTDSAVRISKTGTTFDWSSGTPTGWKDTLESYYSHHVGMKANNEYVMCDSLASTNNEKIYAVVGQVYAAGNGTNTSLNGFKAYGLVGGTVADTMDFNVKTVKPGATDTTYDKILPYINDSVSSWFTVKANNLDGLKIEMTSKSVNVIFSSVKLFFLTEAEYNFANKLATDGATICEAGVGNTTASSELVSLWNELSTNYSSLSETLGAYSLAASSESKYSNHIMDIAIAKYDYIVAKYGLNDFLSRGVSSSSPAIKSLINDSSSITSIVTVIAIGSITLVGGLTLSRKRKEF